MTSWCVESDVERVLKVCRTGYTLTFDSGIKCMPNGYTINSYTNIVFYDNLMRESESNMKYTIAIDTGKAQVKSAMLLDGEVLTLNAFPSNVVPNSTQRLDESVHIVNLDGKTFQVGDASATLTKDQISNLDKKTTESKVCAYTAIALMMKEAGIRNGAEFKVLINVPLSIFKNSDERKEYVSFYKGEVSINVDGTNYFFDIVEVTPLFEAIGYVLLQGKALKGTDTILFDWGGLNLTYCLIDADLRPVVAKSDSLMKGCHNILGDIYLGLQAAGVMNLDAGDIKKVIQGRKNTSKETKALIDQLAYKNISQIFDQLATRLNLWDDKVRFTGGSSLLFEDYITKYFNEHHDFEISSNCVYDNAVGFLKVVG